MEINGYKVRKLKRMFGVDVPEEIQDSPQRALAYITGYSQFKGINYERLNRLVISEEEDPFYRSKEGNMLTSKGEFGNSYEWGKLAAGHKPVGCWPEGGFTKQGPGERVLDAVELQERAHRNPSFIPHWAWNNTGNA